MANYPNYKLYAEDGITLIYTFENVTDDAGILSDPARFVEHESLRARGSVISEGGNSSWDLTLNFILKGDDYDDLIAQMISLQSTIVKFTKYVLKIDITPSTTLDYKVMRTVTMNFPNTRRTKRIKTQDVIATLKIGAWE